MNIPRVVTVPVQGALAISDNLGTTAGIAMPRRTPSRGMLWRVDRGEAMVTIPLRTVKAWGVF